jgi:hypothetical protein
MTQIGGDEQFMRDFEHSTVMTPADKTKAEEGAKGKGDAAGLGATSVGGTSSSSNVVPGETVSGENLSELYLVAMETSYNSQATDMMNKSGAMQSSNEQATDMSQAENAITTAQLNANGGDIRIRIVPDADVALLRRLGEYSNDAFISQSEADMMNNNGLSITDGETVKADDISSLTSSINDIEQTLSGNSDYMLLELQMDTQNLQQDSSLATSGLKTVGDAQSEAARNV